MAFKFNPITGKLDLVGSGGTPAGSDGEIQFNDSGAFGANANLFWNNSSTTKRLSIQAGSSPVTPLHVASAIGATIAAPTFSAILTPEVAATSPTISASQVTGPDDPSALNAVFNYDGTSSYVANGSNWDVVLTTIITIDGLYYSCANPQSFNLGSDANDSSQFSIDSDWTPATIGDGYIIQVLQNGGSVNTWFVNNVTTALYHDDGSSGIPGSVFAGFGSIAYPYFNTSLTDGSLNSATESTGLGNYICNGQTIDYLIYEYRTQPYSGIKYVAGSPYTATVTDSVNDGSTPFQVMFDINPGDGDGRFVTISLDGGVTYPYGFDTNVNMFSDNGDLDPAPDISNLIAAYTGMLRDFEAVGDSNTTSTGATYYSASPFSYSFTDNNPPTGYVIFHDVTVTNNTGASKLLGALDGSLDNSIVISNADFYTNAITSWSGDDVVTPVHYGFLANGSNLNQSFKAFAFSTTSGVYSATSVTHNATDPNDGQYYVITLTSITTGGGDRWKIFKDTGAGFNSAYGPNGFSSFDIDVFGPNFGASLVVTPNTVFPGVATFETDISTVSSVISPTVNIKSTAASNGTPSLGFYRNTTKTGWIGIGTDSTMFFEASQFNFGALNAGFSAPGITFLPAGSATFNNLSNNAQFKVQGSTNQNVLVVRGNDNFATMGSVVASNIFTVLPTLYVEPTSTSREGILIRQPSNFTSVGGDMIRLIDISHPTPGTLFTVDILGHVAIGRGSPIALLHLAGGSTSIPQLKFAAGANLTAPQAGSVEYVNNFTITNTNSVRTTLGGSYAVQNTDATNTTTIESTFYTDTILASTLIRGGDMIWVRYSGTTDAHATATAQIRSYFATTKLIDSGAFAHIAAVDWKLDIYIMRGPSANTVRYTALFFGTGLNTVITNGTFSPTLTSNQQMTVTGQAGGVGAASNQITAQTGSIIFQPSF